MLPYNKKNTQLSRVLRKNMTDEEKHLWYDFLKKLPFAVKRQHPIEGYIVDFYIPQAKLVIEIDGSQHESAENAKTDAERDEVLNSWGIEVLRFSNRRINKAFYSVTCEILEKLGLTWFDLVEKD
jgi:very-short-patch-repair endonuclease